MDTPSPDGAGASRPWPPQVAWAGQGRQSESLASLRRRSIRTLTWPERRCLPRAEARIVGHPCRCQHRTMHERLIASREKRQVCTQVSHPGRACDTERAEFGQRDRPHAQLRDPWILQPMPAVGGPPHRDVQTVEFSAGHAARKKTDRLSSMTLPLLIRCGRPAPRSGHAQPCRGVDSVIHSLGPAFTIGGKANDENHKDISTGDGHRRPLDVLHAWRRACRAGG